MTFGRAARGSFLAAAFFWTLGGIGPARGQTTAIRKSPVVDAYQMAFRVLLPSEAKPRLEAVDISETMNAAPAPLAYEAADAAVHRFAPLALEAVGRLDDAGRLRRLPAVTSVPNAEVAVQQMESIIDVMRRTTMGRPEQEAALESLMSADLSTRQAMHADRPTRAEALAPGNLPASPYDTTRPSGPSTPEAAALAQRAVVSSAGSANDAIRAGAIQSTVIEASLQSLIEVVALARQAGGMAPAAPTPPNPVAPPTPPMEPMPPDPYQQRPDELRAPPPAPPPAPMPPPAPYYPPPESQAPPVVPNPPAAPTPPAPTPPPPAQPPATPGVPPAAPPPQPPT